MRAQLIYHLTGLEKLGAKIELEGGYVIATAKKTQRWQEFLSIFQVSVRPKNVMMAAVLADGESVLENCAREPEIVDLAEGLARDGCRRLPKAKARRRFVFREKPLFMAVIIRSWVIELKAGTYLAAGFGTQGDVTVDGIRAPSILNPFSRSLEESGAIITRNENSRPHCRQRARSRSRYDNSAISWVIRPICKRSSWL